MGLDETISVRLRKIPWARALGLGLKIRRAFGAFISSFVVAARGSNMFSARGGPGLGLD